MAGNRLTGRGIDSGGESARPRRGIDHTGGESTLRAGNRSSGRGIDPRGGESSYGRGIDPWAGNRPTGGELTQAGNRHTTAVTSINIYQKNSDSFRLCV